MNIQQARENKGYTQEDFAHLIDVSLRHYQRIESGQNMPSVRIALRICKLLDIDPRDVDGWTD